jgi:O-antigen/teichoic acid export membrane protein
MTQAHPTESPPAPARKRPPFYRAVLTMMTGTLAAQALPLLVSPLLTRLYKPAEYGIYATFMLVAYSLSVLAAGRYEFAIMLPEDERDAFNVAGFCLVVASGVAAAVLAVVVVMRLTGVDAGARLDRYLFALPPMVLVMSAYQTLTCWVIRKQQFRRLALANVSRAFVTAAANIAFGVMAFRGGLIVSTLLGQTIATLALAVYVWQDPALSVRNLRTSRMVALMKEHRSFPLFTLPADLMSYGSTQLPVAFFDPTSAGVFTFVQTVINTPLSLAAGSVLDAFKERATRDYRERGEFHGILVSLMKSLSALAVAPMLVLAVWGTPIFATVFGEAWRPGGHVARILAIMYLFKFVASPLSYSYYIVGKQREDFILHVYIIASTALILAVGVRWLHDVDLTLIAFSVNYALFYVLYLVRSFQFSRGTGLPAVAGGPALSPELDR